MFYCSKEEKNEEWLNIIKEIESFEKDCFQSLKEYETKYLTENLSKNEEISEEILEIKKHLFGNNNI